MCLKSYIKKHISLFRKALRLNFGKLGKKRICESVQEFVKDGKIYIKKKPDTYIYSSELRKENILSLYKFLESSTDVKNRKYHNR